MPVGLFYLENSGPSPRIPVWGKVLKKMITVLSYFPDDLLIRTPVWECLVERFSARDLCF